MEDERDKKKLAQVVCLKTIYAMVARKWHLRFLIALFSVSIALTSCQEYQEPILPLEGRIIIEMVEEEALPGKWELALQLISEKIYPCFNYPFDFNQKIKRNKIQIEVNGVVESGLCLNATGPAKSKILLGSLENEVFTFEVKTEEEMINGELIVSEDNYRLVLEDNLLIELENEILERR